MSVSKNMKENLVRLSKTTGVELKIILDKYKEIYKSKFVQDDTQFKTDEDKHMYTYRALYVKMQSKQRTEKRIVIPIGYEQPMKTQKGKLNQNIYVLELDDDGKYSKNKIVCRGEKQTNLYSDIKLFHRYEIMAGSGKDVIFASDDTKFEDPKHVPKEPTELIIKYFGAKKITVKETATKPSRIDGDGYPDRQDLRIIRGIVSGNPRVIDRDDGTQGGVYNIGDESITISDEDEVTDDGVIIPNNLTVWCPPEFVKYDEGSLIDFVGYIKLRSKSDVEGTEPQMTAICILPVHPIMITEEE